MNGYNFVFFYNLVLLYLILDIKYRWEFWIVLIFIFFVFYRIFILILCGIVGFWSIYFCFVDNLKFLILLIFYFVLFVRILLIFKVVVDILVDV